MFLARVPRRHFHLQPISPRLTIQHSFIEMSQVAQQHSLPQLQLLDSQLHRAAQPVVERITHLGGLQLVHQLEVTKYNSHFHESALEVERDWLRSVERAIQDEVIFPYEDLAVENVHQMIRKRYHVFSGFLLSSHWPYEYTQRK